MDFLHRLTRLPIAFDPELGDDALVSAPGFEGDIQNLLHGTAGSSPYLKGLIEKETDWLRGAFDGPEAAIAALFTQLRQTAPDQLPNALRMGKRRVALMTALADIAGVWPLETVTGTLTDFADLASDLAIKATIGAEIKRGKLPGATEDDIATAGGMVSIAMGKMGAHELNYSSDIHRIPLLDESWFAPAHYHDSRTLPGRASRPIAVIVSQLTGHGMDNETPVARVQWGTTSRQLTITGTLVNIVDRVKSAGLKSPAIMIVSQVIKLRETMQWF